MHHSEDVQTNIEKFYTFFSFNIRMIGRNIIFNDENVNKSNFYRDKKPFIIDGIDVNRIIISKQGPYG